MRRQRFFPLTGFIYLAIIPLIILATIQPAQAIGIAAVVNDEAITEADLANRVALVFLSSGLPQDAESRKRIAGRVLQNLIDEHLQMQVARRYGIEVAQDEIKAAMGKMAAQNRMSPEQMEAYLESRGIPRQTMIDQVKANLSWRHVAQRVLRPQVAVGDDEVNAALERLKANEGKPEYQMSEIFLAVNSPADEDRVRQLAGNLVTRIKEGAPFGAVAQQFSQGIGAINGGDMGWIQPGQLQGELDRAVRGLEVGMISLPIRTADGFHILGKRDQRRISASDPNATEMHLMQASMPLKGRTSSDIERFIKTAKTCESLKRPEGHPGWSIADLGTKKAGALPEWLARMARNQAVNEPGAVVAKSGYAIVLYVCARAERGSNRDAVINSIGFEKLQLQAQRLLRDLRRSALIDIRTTG